MFDKIKKLFSCIPIISSLKKMYWEYDFYRKFYDENKSRIEKFSLQPPNKYRYKANVPVTRITSDPLYHWGAYFDQLHFDPTNRYVISNEVDFQHRTPEPDDRITVGVIDTQDNFRWIPIGSTVAWNWQQGCMLQWIPGSSSEVIWNDRVDGCFVSFVYDINTKKRRQLPAPVYGLSPNGEFALFPDFARLGDTRPGYGYCGIPDVNHDVLAPDNSGIWKMDLKTGVTKLLFSVSDIVSFNSEGRYSPDSKHWFNHVIVSPDSSEFIFLHRWRGADEGTGWKTRLYVASTKDGGNLRLLNDYGYVSHLLWRDPDNLISYSFQPQTGNSLYLYNVKTGSVKCMSGDFIKEDTHVSFVPGTNGEWILNDSYPNEFRFQSLYLYHLPTQTRIDLGEFYSPEEYVGEWRCDLHPRCSRDGKKVIFDSAHEGLGRQIYMVDISEFIK